MEVKIDKSFQKDTRKIKDKSLLTKITLVIDRKSLAVSCRPYHQSLCATQFGSNTTNKHQIENGKLRQKKTLGEYLPDKGI